MFLRARLALVVLGFAALSAACGGSSSSGTGTGGTAGIGASGGAGGGGGVGGLGGSGGAPVVPVNKVDLLLMVDNSISMADKQEILSQAVPRLIQRLVNPTPDPATGKLPFQPVADLHVGVITSSLGGHGGDQCSQNGPGFNPTQDDHGRLVPSVRTGLSSYDALGFLWWDPAGPAGGDVAKLTGDFAAEISAAGELGCGYEAQLEAWYRFLVDPNPPAAVVVNNNVAELQGTDATVLQQRKDFLRPDSAVVIAMLTDENDCSIVDGGFGWIAAQTSNPNNTAFHLPRATQACDNDPNDACCQSCSASAENPGCPPLANDPNCAQGMWDDVGDQPNLRCWEQKRRFGLDFLYPTRRYSEALTQPTICPTWDSTGPTGCAAGSRVPNPLMAPARNPGLVFLVGIVGVPWQDLATDATLNDPNALELRSGAELAAQGRFDWLTPKCKTMVSPGELPAPAALCDVWDLKDSPDDPYMIESTAPRTGSNPASNTPLVDPSGGELASPINGHEYLTNQNNLEYACIFKLATPKDCSTVTGGCDCMDTGSANYDPLCQSGSSYSNVQTYAKGYPGIREIEVLRDVSGQAVLGSICPKTTADPSSSGYGYFPVVDALVKRLAPVLQ